MKTLTRLKLESVTKYIENAKDVCEMPRSPEFLWAIKQSQHLLDEILIGIITNDQVSRTTDNPK